MSEELKYEELYKKRKIKRNNKIRNKFFKFINCGFHSSKVMRSYSLVLVVGFSACVGIDSATSNHNCNMFSNYRFDQSIQWEVSHEKNNSEK